VPSKIEVGVQFSSLMYPKPSPSFGGVASKRNGKHRSWIWRRFTFNLNKNIALEAEGNFFPIRPSTIPTQQWRLLARPVPESKPGNALASLASLQRRGRVLRASVRCSPQVGTSTIGYHGQLVTFPIFDRNARLTFQWNLGGVLEFYPSRKVLTRSRCWRHTIVHYGRDPFPSSLALVRASRPSHHLQVSAGIGFRLGSIQPEEPATPGHEEKKQRFRWAASFHLFSFTEAEHFAGSPPFQPPFEFRDTRTQIGFGGRFCLQPHAKLRARGAGRFFHARSRCCSITRGRVDERYKDRRESNS